MKKALSAILAALTVLLCLSSCSSDDSVVLFFAIQDTAQTFDPQIASDKTARTVVRNCFEGLIRPGADKNVLPGVAQKWNISADGLTYTFYLRNDAVWHLTSNAKENLSSKLPQNFDLSVTAYDFEFALKRALSPETAATDAHMLTSIQNAYAVLAGEMPVSLLGIKATDKFTLVITLSQPDASFLSKLCEPVAMPCNQTFFEACGGRYGILIKYSLSNGPFYLSRFDETSYRINKSPDYVGDAAVKADAVWLYTENDTDALLTDLTEGDYSGAVLSEAQYNKLKQTKTMTVTKNTDINRSFIINTQHPVLQNINIRNAFFAAIDVNSFVEDQERTKCTSFVPLAAADSNDTGAKIAFDSQKALAFLNKGLEDLQITTVSVTVKTDLAFEDALKRQLQKWQKILGVRFNIKISAVSEEELKRAVEANDYDIAFYPVKAPSNSSDDFFSMFSSLNGGNITGIKEEILDNKINALLSAGQQNRAKACSELIDTLSSYAVILPVWQESTYLVCTEKVSGVNYFTGNDRLYFENATNK